MNKIKQDPTSSYQDTLATLMSRIFNCSDFWHHYTIIHISKLSVFISLQIRIWYKELFFILCPHFAFQSYDIE
jgi:hypothetical protein